MRFEEVKTRFWDAAVDLEVFAPLSPADVERAHAVLGVRLPDEYVELLQIQNGGYVSRDFDAFPTDVPTSWAEDHVWFRTLAGIGPTDAWPSVTTNAGLLDQWKMPAGLVLLSGEGHFWIALDYRGLAPEDEPSVVWFDNEVDEDLALAPSFRAFVEGLVPMESFAYPDVDPAGFAYLQPVGAYEPIAHGDLILRTDPERRNHRVGSHGAGGSSVPAVAESASTRSSVHVDGAAGDRARLRR